MIELRFELSSRGRHKVTVEHSVDPREPEDLERVLEAIGRAARSYATNGSSPTRIAVENRGPAPRGEE